jgi:hypothetical protein
VADKETYLRGHGTGQKINPTLLGNDDDSGGKGGNPKNHIDPGCWKASFKKEDGQTNIRSAIDDKRAG